MFHQIHDESLHNFTRQYYRTLSRLFPEEFPISGATKTIALPYSLNPKNNALLHAFYLHVEAMGVLSMARRARLFMMLGTIGEFLGEKSFDMLTKEDVQQLVATVRHQPRWSSVTQNYHLKALKKFLKHLNGGDEYPLCITWLKVMDKRHSPIQKEDLITEEEMARMLQMNVNPMHRCLLALLWEGLRVGELGTLRCKNISFEGKEVFISVKGKTGERTVMSITGAPYIRQWLDFHPTKNPNDWLFVISSNFNKGQHLGYASIRNIVRESCIVAGINRKRTHPHLFRHSSITDRRRKGMRQREASAFYGVSGEVMSQVYDHLADTDVHNEIRRVLGVKTEVQIPTNKMEPKHCTICQKMNPHYSTTCLNCGNAFSINDSIKQKDQLRELEEQNQKFQNQLDKMNTIIATMSNALETKSLQEKAEIMQKIKGGITQ